MSRKPEEDSRMDSADQRLSPTRGWRMATPGAVLHAHARDVSAFCPHHTTGRACMEYKAIVAKEGSKSKTSEEKILTIESDGSLGEMVNFRTATEVSTKTVTSEVVVDGNTTSSRYEEDEDTDSETYYEDTESETESTESDTSSYIAEEEADGMTKAMSDIVGFADTINSASEAGVEEFDNINNIQNAFREDVVVLSYDRDEILKNVNDMAEDHFFVRKRAQDMADGRAVFRSCRLLLWLWLWLSPSCPLSLSMPMRVRRDSVPRRCLLNRL